MSEKRTNKEILICLEIKLIELKKQFENHLAHHRRILYALIGVAGTAFISFAVLIAGLLM